LPQSDLAFWCLKPLSAFKSEHYVTTVTEIMPTPIIKYVMPITLMPMSKGAHMKNLLPIDSDEPLLKEISGEGFKADRSDEELHQLLQYLIDSDHRLLVELKLAAWHEACLLNGARRN
jgi:hypothetical protein